MKEAIAILLCFAFCFGVVGCKSNNQPNTDFTTPDNAVTMQIDPNATVIALTDSKITVNDEEISNDENSPVNLSNDIVYYKDGQDFTYGEGQESDAHSENEAKIHKVVNITKPGEYSLSGSLSAGQIAVNLGEEAKNNPEATVTLYLNGVDITCTVAPAVIFYSVYECDTADEDSATKDVNTEKAGARIILADGKTNNINGSYVAKIYKSVELNDDKTEVVDSKKLHKYDGAFYSKMSMNIYAEKEQTGILNIYAENEGLGTERHLTIYSGNINIKSGNDGINVNEDNISVACVKGGCLDIVVTGKTGEGDGIDSNGWLVIEGGSVTASACSISGDAGVDADKGVYLTGGNVVASGNMFDKIAQGTQYAVFTFSARQKGGTKCIIKSADSKTVVECAPANDFQ